MWLMALFTYTATLKMYDDRGTQATLGAFRVPRPVLRPVAQVLAAIEAMVMGLLVLEPTRASGGIAAAFLGTLFTASASVALIRRLDTSCGCAGLVGLGRLGPIAVVRGLVILAAGFLVASQPPVIEAAWEFLVVGVAATPAIALFALRSRHRRLHHRHADQHPVQGLERPRQELLELLNSPPHTAGVRS